MDYIKGLSGTDTLGALPIELERKIKRNTQSVKQSIKTAQQLKGLRGLGKTNTKTVMPFKEVVKKYNKGISREEIKAWVWHRRRLGIPMYGWESYFLKSGTVQSDLVIAKKATTVKDNHFRDTRTVPEGSVLGTATKKSHKYDGMDYLIVRSQDNELIYVAQRDIERETVIITDQKELDSLVKLGALFYIDGELLPEPIYTFGNIYEKFEQLKKDKKEITERYGESVYLDHWDILESRKPKPLTVMHENPDERPFLAPYYRFAKSFTLDMLKPDSGVIIDKVATLTEAFILWLNTLPREDFKESSAYNITKYYIEGETPTPTTMKSYVKQRKEEMKNAGAKTAFTDKETANLTKEIREDLKASAKNEGEILFSRFLHEALTKEYQEKLDAQWNKLYNGDAEINYTRIPMGCELSETWNGFHWAMKPVQREGVGFMEAVESGILAFDVGVGKTLTAIVELAQALHDGKCKRALVCVPNAVYEKWKAEMFGQYDKKGNMINAGILTGTDIKLNEWGNLGSKWLNKINTNQVPEKSITLINYNGLVNIGFSMKVAESFIEELKSILTQSYDQSNREEVKEGQKILETIGNALEKNLAQFDKVGFDYLVIDEAHNFKNIFSRVKKDKLDKKSRFKSTIGNTTERGVKAFFFTNFIQRRFGKNVMLLSATPFENQPIEVYSMLSLVSYDTMKRREILNINDFFELHVREQIENVVTVRETIEPRPVVKAFNNRMLLQSLIYNSIIYRTADNEKRPEKINLPKVNEKKDGRIKRLSSKDQILTYLKMTPMQRDIQNDIVKNIEAAIQDRSFSMIFGFMSQSLNNALSPFIAMGEHPADYKEFVEESPKIKYTLECIRTVKEYHENKGELCSGQIIYINRGKEYFKYIKEWLEKELGFKRGLNYKQFQKEQGVKESEILDIRGTFDEVMIIEGGNTSPEKKDAIKEAFNAGVVKVVIGTAAISEGMDFQKRGTVIYNCYPEFNPTKLRQLEGRIWRFGNPYEWVRIVLPLVQDSMDVFIFQKLEEKTARINDIWYRSDRGNVLDMDALDPEEVKFALITKTGEIANIIISKESKELERKIGIVSGNIPVLKAYKQDKGYYDQKREYLLTELYRWTKNLEQNDYVVNPPSNEYLKRQDKKIRDLVKSDLELHARCKDFEAKGNAVSDMEIAMHVRRLSARFDYFSESTYDSYKLVRDKIVKTEKLFTGKGFTANDDIDKIIKNYEKEAEQLRKELSNILSESHYYDVLDDVNKKKSSLKIEGKSVMERVKEFAALNYVLDHCNKAPLKIEPDKHTQPDGEDDDELELMEAEAEAKLKLLNLLSLN